MKKILGKKRIRIKQGLFPEKLFKILQNKKNESIIHWDEEGKIVVIENEYNLSKLKGDFFKGQKNSFIRLLNLYGFEKIQGSSKDCYFHANFTKNTSLEDIRKIKRKKKLSVVTKEDKENDIKIDDILSQIKSLNDDQKIIEKFKSVINDEKIRLNIKFIDEVKEYINKKINEVETKQKELLDNTKKYSSDIDQNKTEKNKNIYQIPIIFEKGLLSTQIIKHK